MSEDLKQRENKGKGKAVPKFNKVTVSAPRSQADNSPKVPLPYRTGLRPLQPAAPPSQKAWASNAMQMAVPSPLPGVGFSSNNPRPGERKQTPPPETCEEKLARTQSELEQLNKEKDDSKTFSRGIYPRSCGVVYSQGLRYEVFKIGRVISTAW